MTTKIDRLSFTTDAVFLQGASVEASPCLQFRKWNRTPEEIGVDNLFEVRKVAAANSVGKKLVFRLKLLTILSLST